MYWQQGCHDPPAGRPNYGPSTSTQQVLHQQVQVLGEHKTLADGCPARRYKISPARDSQKTSRSTIVSPRTLHKLHHQGTTTKRGGTWLSPVQAALHHQESAACKGMTASTFSVFYRAPRVDPTPPLRGHDRLLVLQ